MGVVRRLERIGESVGLLLDDAVLSELGWDENTEIDLRSDGASLTLVRVVYASDRDVEDEIHRMAARHEASLRRLAR